MRQSHIIIRSERPADDDAIDRVESAAFPTRDEADLVRALRRPGARPFISLVAEVDARIVGHILFTPVTVASKGETWAAMGLGPMAVEPAEQRRGVGSRLVRAGLDACRAIGGRVVVVLGHPSYYPRFGFARADRLGLFWEHLREPNDAFMVAELTPGALARRTGVVRYRREFGSR
jgi:putative acetyltransferase